MSKKRWTHKRRASRAERRRRWLALIEHSRNADHDGHVQLREKVRAEATARALDDPWVIDMRYGPTVRQLTSFGKWFNPPEGSSVIRLPGASEWRKLAGPEPTTLVQTDYAALEASVLAQAGIKETK